MLYVLLTIVLLIVLVGVIYLNFSSQIGARAQEIVSDNILNGRFKNLVETPMSTGDKNFASMMYDYFFNKHPDVFPKEKIETKKIDLEKIKKLGQEEIAITWLGHSINIISTKGLNIITDPILNGKSIPPMYMGPKPFPYTNSYPKDALPQIDIVLISHDHYDHLDMESVKKLKGAKFYVPLGVRAHLMHWGIDGEDITELDWYTESEYSDDLKLAFTPTRHFSGRGLLNGRKTLWGSWVMDFGEKKVYFSGDTGYFDEFKKIGEKYGPFDLALLDAGQYNDAWSNVHMTPEEAIQAGIDIGAKRTQVVHSAKYVLAMHAWYEPLERFYNEAKKKEIEFRTPMIGETYILEKENKSTKWWNK